MLRGEQTVARMGGERVVAGCPAMRCNRYIGRFFAPDRIVLQGEIAEILKHAIQDFTVAAGDENRHSMKFKAFRCQDGFAKYYRYFVRASTNYGLTRRGFSPSLVMRLK
jgi:hypothetical protein